MNFFIIFTIVIFIGCTYISLRLIPRTSLRGYKRVLAYALCYLPMLAMPIRYHARTLSRAGDIVPQWLDMAVFGAYICIGSLSVLATVAFLTDIFLMGKKFLGRKKTSAPPSNERRIFMQNALSAGIMVTGGSLVAYGANEAMGVPDVKHIRVPIENLPKEFQGFKIAQLTDLHINKPIGPERLEKIVEKVNALKANTVVITGDMSDTFPNQVQKELNPLLKITAPDGKYFVSGNHEYYTDIDAWLAEMQRLDFTDLHNEHKVIEKNGQRLLMCGVPDISAPRMSNHASSPMLAQKGSREGDIKILLAHQPQSVYEGVKAGYHLQISGHTHGGQFIPWTYVTDWVQPYIHGLYDVEKTKLYVSRGTGYWGPPIRIGAPPEITLLELVTA